MGIKSTSGTVTIAGDVVRVQEQKGYQYVPIRDVCEVLGLDRAHQRKHLALLKTTVVCQTLRFISPSGRAVNISCVRRDSLVAWVLSIRGGGKSIAAVTRWKVELTQGAPGATTSEAHAMREEIADLKAELLDAYRDLRRLQKRGYRGGMNNV